MKKKMASAKSETPKKRVRKDNTAFEPPKTFKATPRTTYKPLAQQKTQINDQRQGDENRFEKPKRTYQSKDGSFKRPYDDKPNFKQQKEDNQKKPTLKTSYKKQENNEGFADKKRSYPPKSPSSYGQKTQTNDQRQGDENRFEKPKRTYRSEDGSFKRPYDSKPNFKQQKEDNQKNPTLKPSYNKQENSPEFNNKKNTNSQRITKRHKPEAPTYNLKNPSFGERPKKQRTPESKTPVSQDLRLNRYIANAGVCSRREADELIASGQITVNGKVVNEMGFKVKRSDVVRYGKKILNPEKLVYLLLNKPKDYITTTDDPEERKTVMDLIAGACTERIYPVGRLDRNTTGLLLFTNDGELAEKLSHPSNEVKKIYHLELDKPLQESHYQEIMNGFELEDGFIKADDLGILTADALNVGIEIHSGRNRIVRRIFEHFGYQVLKLDRTMYAGLTKKDISRGMWRFLTEKEVVRLKFML